MEGLTGPPAEMVEWTPAPEDQWLMDAKFEADKDSKGDGLAHGQQGRGNVFGTAGRQLKTAKHL